MWSLPNLPGGCAANTLFCAYSLCQVCGFSFIFKWNKLICEVFQVNYISGNIPFLQRRQWCPTPVLLPRKSHGRRSLVGCSPWGRSSRTRLSDFTFTFHFYALEKEMATHSSVLAWRIPGTGSLVGCRLWGHTESDTTKATQQQQHSFFVHWDFSFSLKSGNALKWCYTYFQDMTKS